MTPDQIKKILEAAIFTRDEPVSSDELALMFAGEISVDSLVKIIGEIAGQWRDSGLELVEVASGWRFRSKAWVQPYLDRLDPQKPPKYTRATLETLAIIAYRQPVTRGDIEEVRGVSVSSHILKILEARGWIETVGQREVPGRPALLATTKKFLDDFNLRELAQLPPLDEMIDLLET